MEHYKSTLGVTAAAISALVLAAQILQAGPFADSPPRVERVGTSIQAAADDTAWVNPPVRQQSEPVRQVTQVETAAAEATPAEVSAPTMTQALAPVAAQTLARQTGAAPRKAASAQRRKVAQRAARTRHATLETPAPAVAAAPQVAPAAQPPAETKRIDPIGDIIRGLGFGREG